MASDIDYNHRSAKLVVEKHGGVAVMTAVLRRLEEKAKGHRDSGDMDEAAFWQGAAELVAEVLNAAQERSARPH